MRIVLFGPPGAGKGTQAHFLAEAFGLTHIATGNILRAAVRDETPVGLEAKRYMVAGELVPSVVVWKLAQEAIAASSYTHFMLDGYPRTVEQAQWLDADLEEKHRPIQAVVSLVVPDETIVARLSGRRTDRRNGDTYHIDYNPPPPGIDPEFIIQRKDDTPEAVLHRLEVYHEETAPLKAYYRERGVLHEFDGEGEMDDVHARIVAGIAPLIESHSAVAPVTAGTA